jgi:hypothetical protein
MPTTKEIKSARRLMTHAEIFSVRLLAARVDGFSHTWNGIVEGGGRQGEIQIAIPPPKTQGEMTQGYRLRVLVKYLLLGKHAAEESASPLFRIGSTFELVYSLPNVIEPTPKEIRAFCQTNVMLNSWPYWREFVQNTIIRMNLPPLTLPLFRLVSGPSVAAQSENQRGQKATPNGKTKQSRV